jgi:hypothetical protein
MLLSAYHTEYFFTTIRLELTKFLRKIIYGYIQYIVFVCEMLCKIFFHVQ